MILINLVLSVKLRIYQHEILNVRIYNYARNWYMLDLLVLRIKLLRLYAEYDFKSLTHQTLRAPRVARNN